MKNKSHHYCSTRLITLLLLMLSAVWCHGQDRQDSIRRKLEAISKESPGLLNSVDISVNGVSVEEFLRGLAYNNEINVAVEERTGITLVSNFKNTRVIDVLVYLCINYALDLTTTGNIITIRKYRQPAAAAIIYVPKQPVIRYDPQAGTLSFDLKSDSLMYVCRTITELTGRNIIYPPELRSRLMSGFLEQVPFEKGMEKIAALNNISFNISPDSFCVFGPQASVVNPEINNGNKTSKNYEKPVDGLRASVSSPGKITISAANIAIDDIIKAASAELGINYFLQSEMKEKVSLNMEHAGFEELLNALLLGTNYSYRADSNTYIIGARDKEGLRNCSLLQLQHRSVADITKLIPEALKQKVSISEFPDVNSLIMCGAAPDIRALQLFIIDMDKTVPQVMIEVLIVDKQTSHNVKTGVKAGLGDKPVSTSGQVFPEFDMNLGSDVINSLISSFNGFGIINLGKVTPNFYVSLSAMENNGIINIRSTPKLATMNGKEAKMTIGSTEYYVEETNNVIGSQNPQNFITKTYKSVDAEFSLTIKPMVQGDDQMTLEVQVGQSDFTGKISTTAPPGKVSRNFNSTVRIRDQEMILLGGLEEKKNDDAGDGVPLLSRVPVLKWLFSSRNKSRSSKKLNIFIRPTIIY